MKRNQVPRILLVGAGRFGEKHLRVLTDLEREGAIVLAGVVVRSDKHCAALARTFGDRAYTRVTPRMLQQVDGVVIATPNATHASLAHRCLAHTSVFVEKPLALTSAQAEALAQQARTERHVLMVGHIFRFHPLTQALVRAVAGKKITRIDGSFVSPVATHRGDNTFFEQIHLFDLIDLLLAGKESIVVWANGTTTYAQVTLRYAPHLDAHLTIGWEGARKERSLAVTCADGTVFTAEYGASTLTEYRQGVDAVVRICAVDVEPLRAEHEAFSAALRTGRVNRVVDAQVGVRAVRTAERLTKALVRRPRVAVIGGGVFGITAGLIFGDHYDVTIFERHREIMTEATWVNQYRHHGGYHYPRSMATIDQIIETRDTFARYYRGVVVKKPSYYCVSNDGSLTAFDRFTGVCTEKGLPHDEAYPDPRMLDRSTVEGCVLTNEYVYDIERLKRVAHERIDQLRSTSLKSFHEVTGITLTPSGRKLLTVRDRASGRTHALVFDVVINATYANYNRLCRWLKVPEKELEYRFKELVVIELPHAPKQAVTIMDGPFATIVPIGRTKLFTLGDVPTSVHARTTQFSDATFATWRKQARSRYHDMIARCQPWFPILADARYVESRYVTLPVEVSANATDARTSSVVEHGFGCYSVLEGKICTSVSMARKIMDLFRRPLAGVKRRSV